MKRKTAYAIFISAIFLCFALILGGTYLDNQILVYVGMALLFGGSFLFAIITMIVMFIRARKKADEMDKRDPNTPAQDSEYPQNRYEAATGVFAFTIRGFRRSSPLQKILMILFLLITVGSVLAGIVLLSCGFHLAAYICFGVFGGVFLIGLITAIIASYVGR